MVVPLWKTHWQFLKSLHIKLLYDFKKKNKFIYVFLAVLKAARGLSLVVASGGYSALGCVGFSLWWLLLLQSRGSRHTGSVIVARGLQ